MKLSEKCPNNNNSDKPTEVKITQGENNSQLSKLLLKSSILFKAE